MRQMNKVLLTSRQPIQQYGPAAILGTGSTWKRVFKYIPRDKYTLVHGTCTGVGVAGCILGGGFGYGVSQRYGTGASNVLQYTLVYANGRIFKACIKIIHQINFISE